MIVGDVAKCELFVHRESLGTGVTSEGIAKLDKKICTVATTISSSSSDPVNLALMAVDVTLDVVLPDYEAVPVTKSADDEKANNNAPKPTPVVAAAAAPLVARAPLRVELNTRAVTLHKRLVQRLQSLLHYIGSSQRLQGLWSYVNSSNSLVSDYAARSSRLVADYAARVPNRQQASESLQILLDRVLSTATELRQSVSSRQQALLDQLTTKLQSVKADVRNNQLSAALIRRCSEAVLQAHERLLAAVSESKTLSECSCFPFFSDVADDAQPNWRPAT